MTEDRIAAIYRQHAARLARRTASDTGATAAVRVLVMRLGEERFAIELREVTEIVSHPECVPVPGSPQALAGVINLRGEIRPVWELARLLGIADGGAGGGCVVFLRGSAGLRVDHTDEIRELGPGEWLQPAEAAPHVKAVTPDLLTVLDPQRLLEEATCKD